MSGSSAVSKRPGSKTRMPMGKMPGKKAGSASAMGSFSKAKAKMGNKKMRGSC